MAMESKSDDNEVAQVKHASVEKEETTEKVIMLVMFQWQN